MKFARPGKSAIAGICAAGAFAASGAVLAWRHAHPTQAPAASLHEYPCAYLATPYGHVAERCTTPAASADSPPHAAGSTRPSSATFELPASSGRVAKLELFSGEKSVFAGRDRFMSLAVVESADNRPVRDGTVVEFLTDGVVQGRAVTTGGVAHVFTPAPRQAGYIEISATSDGIGARSNTIRVVPSEPVAIGAERPQDPGAITDDDRVWLKTEPLKDRFGNAIADGMLVQFAGVDGHGRRLILNAQTVNGLAATKLINRQLGDEVAVSGHFKDIAGPAETIAFEPMRLVLELDAAVRSSQGSIDIDLGPIRQRGAGFVNDGLIVTLEMPGGESVAAKTIDGFASFHVTRPGGAAAPQFTFEAQGLRWSFELDCTADCTRNLRLAARGPAS